MTKGRMEAFSDGVLAIIITIMVLEMRAPHDSQLAALLPLAPVFLSYVLSFVYIGIYWSNHHHLLAPVEHVDGGVLWSNLHLLFWLSLVPFVTAWMGENHWSAGPTALYGGVLFMAALAYDLLTRRLIHHHARGSRFVETFGNARKRQLSLLAYAVGIGLSLLLPWLGFAVYVLVALMWFVPDPRAEGRAR